MSKAWDRLTKEEKKRIRAFAEASRTRGVNVPLWIEAMFLAEIWGGPGLPDREVDEAHARYRRAQAEMLMGRHAGPATFRSAKAEIRAAGIALAEIVCLRFESDLRSAEGGKDAPEDMEWQWVSNCQWRVSN